VQATVSAWDERRRRAQVLLDDGRELPVPQRVIDEAGFVRLRLGQRLTVELADHLGEDGGQVDRVRLLG
jgi:hypothetical protein